MTEHVIDQFRLTGKTALVAGIGPAIGQAVARTFADAGAHVVVTARTAERVEALVDDIRAGSGTCDGYVGDLTDPASRAALLRAAGTVDILFYNAYAIGSGDTQIFDLASPLDTTEADWEACFRTNIMAPFALAQALVPSMTARGSGSFITCVAAAAFTPILPAIAYGVTKAGLMTMIKYLAKACGPAVRFNAISPSNIEVEGRPKALLSAVRTTPLQRMGLPEEVASTALYLASDAAAFVTGEVIHVDGGRVSTA